MNPVLASLRACRYKVSPYVRRQPALPGNRPVLRFWVTGPTFQSRQIHWWPILAPPAILTGLFVGLWCWKCAMLVLFQNMIIYNPFLPPNARSLRIKDFEKLCGRVSWREERIRSLDGTEIALCVSQSVKGTVVERSDRAKAVYILYFQGNAASTPPRLPDLSRILERLVDQTVTSDVQYTMVCLSYRGYWTSHDRPSEQGIDQDAKAALRWVHEEHQARGTSGQEPAQLILILYGQSIGCGFATNLAAASQSLSVNGVVLETPFTSTRDMLKALYPQKWLPYQYLWPFLRSHLDTWRNLGLIAANRGTVRPQIHIVEAGRDELVPAAHGEQLYQRCRELGLPVQRTKIPGALHNDVTLKAAGKQAIQRSIASIVAQV